MANIAVITFDLDNTLWDVESVVIGAERQMRGWLSEHVPEYENRFSREEMMELRRTVVAAKPELTHDLSALRETVLFHAISACGYGEREARQHAAKAFEIFFEARQQVVFFEHALDTLEHLAGRYRLGALTNGNAHIGRIGLDRYFSFAFSAADVGISKPAPDMFHAALEHCSVKPEETIHVGDNLVDDVRGARGVGMHTIWTNHSGDAEPEDHQPTAIVSSLADLPAAVLTIHEG